MDENTSVTTTRRSLLAAVGGGLGVGSSAARGAGATQDDSQCVLVQGERCVPIRPLRSQLPVETFYEYHLPAERVMDENGAVGDGSVTYASAGTRNLQREHTSIAFLYQGPKGTSLVFVHGSVGNPDAGAVTFQLYDMPTDGEWVVKDDLYPDPETGDIAETNYDQWATEGDDHRIDWTWGTSGTDGGAFRGLGEEFSVTVQPAFNEAAALYGDHYEGRITDWQFLSGSASLSERISLELDEPIQIRTGGCGDDDN
ncbi:hypothetical protein M0R88_04250 [Halorussus gelatinilyticus]|uniref:Uncharacterized protein n=1 Tax=Halorussus gelatinilyticus TaxID=2937524 RepID=A0A8U0IMS0_9EURY|nr:hypothetical protein [Halorussus gelatinilyticus]UPW01319.1 hypothetical protein M0R88_04250 [Halorussus gelatinilyticus]